MASTSSAPSPFSALSDDLLLHIFNKLSDDPRDWPRLSCVSSRFSSLIHHVLYRSHCLLLSPPDLIPSSSFSSLHKLSLCCPGLLHSGILFEHSDFGLERDIGPHHLFPLSTSSSSSTHQPPSPFASTHQPPSPLPSTHQPSPPFASTHQPSPPFASTYQPPSPPGPTAPDCGGWSLYDDLYFDTVYDISEAHITPPEAEAPAGPAAAAGSPVAEGSPAKKRRVGPHLAEGRCASLSREQGRKLLASRFRGDALYLTEFPGCVHAEERRSYMVFRGVFKDFKRSSVWREIEKGRRRATELECAYCDRRETWDLHAAFCLRSAGGYHDDGEPVVRAFVCENGHVSGAWTERPACG